MGIVQRRTAVGGSVRFHSSAHRVSLHLGMAGEHVSQNKLENALSVNKNYQQQANKALLPAGELGRYLALFHLLGCSLKVFGESSRLAVQRSLNQIVLSTLLKPRFVAEF